MPMPMPMPMPEPCDRESGAVRDVASLPAGLRRQPGAVARALRPGLRRGRVVAFPGHGPMAPVTRSDIVNAESASLVAVA